MFVGNPWFPLLLFHLSPPSFPSPLPFIPRRDSDHLPLPSPCEGRTAPPWLPFRHQRQGHPGRPAMLLPAEIAHTLPQFLDLGLVRARGPACASPQLPRCVHRVACGGTPRDSSRAPAVNDHCRAVRATVFNLWRFTQPVSGTSEGGSGGELPMAQSRRVVEVGLQRAPQVQRRLGPAVEVQRSHRL